MDLRTNAVEAIQVGVEDYHTGTRPRLLAAVRNIHAGILLLLKEVLRMKAPGPLGEALIKAKLVPSLDLNGKVIFMGSGKKTIDTQQIQERCEGVGITVDWKALARIAEVRNDIEHYVPRHEQAAIRDVVASAMVLIRRLAVEQLAIEPSDLLGQPTWSGMLQIEAVHAVERNECDVSFASIDWESEVLAAGLLKLRCPVCASDLLSVTEGSTTFDDASLCCRACGVEQKSGWFIPAALAIQLDGDDYSWDKDGGDDVVGECPFCYEDTYIDSEQRCAHCGYSAERTCHRCGNHIPLSELSSAPLCGYCEHVMSKDD